jgi:hypothetical protein
MGKKSRHFKRTRKPVAEKVEKLGVKSNSHITKDEGWHVKVIKIISDKLQMKKGKIDG